eukprot:1161760-Pelagomonas_calceolata.AAC.6
MSHCGAVEKEAARKIRQAILPALSCRHSEPIQHTQSLAQGFCRELLWRHPELSLHAQGFVQDSCHVAGITSCRANGNN